MKSDKKKMLEVILHISINEGIIYIYDLHINVNYFNT